MKVFSFLINKMMSVETPEKKAGRISICILISALIFIAIPAWSADYYISPSGTGDGSSCSSPKSVTWNWTSPNVVAGDTVHLCSGTYSRTFTVPKSGSSGNPITVKFESGAKFSTTVWGTYSSAAIVVSQSYIIIDGNNVGIVENTANGDGLANQSASFGVYVAGDYVEIKGLTIRNIYQKTYWVETPSVQQEGIFASGCDHFTADHNTITYCNEGIMYSNTRGSTKTNIVMSHNTLSHCNIATNVAAYYSGSNVDQVYINDNDITINDDWIVASNVFHNNCTHIFTDESSPNNPFISNIYYYNNYLHYYNPSSRSAQTTSFLYVEFGISSMYVYNNLFVGDPNKAAWPSYGFIGMNITMSSAPTVKIYNNTMIGFRTDADLGIHTANNMTVRNNIMKTMMTGIRWRGSPQILSDYNDFYNCDYVGWNLSTNTGYTLSSWRSYLGRGCPSASDRECNSATSKPSLDSNYVPTVGDTVVKWKGTATGQLSSTDKAGVTWHSPPSIGAYEYRSEK